MRTGLTSYRYESPLGRFDYVEWRPARLAGLVERLWASEGRLTHPRERILPTGGLELLVNLDPAMRRPAGTQAALAPVSLLGLRRAPLVLDGPMRSRVVAIRLWPAGAFALLGHPLSDLGAAQLDLSHGIGRAAEELAERCWHAETSEARVQVAADWLASRTADAPGMAPAIRWSLDQITRSHGQVAIADLHKATGLSRAAMAAAFRRDVGLTPKLYARIARLRRVTALLDRGAGSLGYVAAAAGYSDQAHFNRDFREFAGVSPRRFLAMRYPQGFGAAEPTA